MNNTKVIAVSGVSGAGKTTIVKQLAKEFHCPFLLFDDHTDKSTYPQDMKDWLKNGSNVSLIKTPKLVNSLHRLILKITPVLFLLKSHLVKSEPLCRH